MKRGTLFIISGPSGVGKNAIIRKVLESNKNVDFIQSMTTRPMRPDEAPGEPYHFTSRELFIEKIKSGAMLEWQTISGNIYGSSKEAIQNGLAMGSNLITDLDVFGAHAAMLALPTDVCTVFIIPPSVDELRRRIMGRNNEAPPDFDQRMARASFEPHVMGMFDYALPNENLEVAVRELNGILRSHSYRKNVAESVISSGNPLVVRSIQFEVAYNRSLAASAANSFSGRLEIPKTRMGFAETKESALQRLIKMLSFKTSIDLNSLHLSIRSTEEREIAHTHPVHNLEYMSLCRVAAGCREEIEKLARTLDKLAEINKIDFKDQLCF